MSELQAITDRVEIEALPGEFTDAVMMRDYDRLASLFTPDGAVRMPHIDAEATSREEIRAGIERLQGVWDVFIRRTPEGWKFAERRYEVRYVDTTPLAGRNPHEKGPK
jgi:hypothetical protein